MEPATVVTEINIWIIIGSIIGAIVLLIIVVAVLWKVSFFIKCFQYGIPYEMSRIVRKPDFCLGENKGADQLRGNREADQRLCFRYSDCIIPLLLKSEISSF